MEFKFYYPLKDKNISPFKKAKAEISIPAKLLENILTNRQKKLKNNKSFDKSKGSFKHISITDSSSASKSKKMYSKLQLSSDKDRNIISKQSLIEENKKLKIENAQLKNKIKELQRRNQSPFNNNHKETLANLIMSLSYEKQSDDISNVYQTKDTNIKLKDDTYTKKGYQLLFNKVYKRTEKLLIQYDNALKRNLNTSRQFKSK